MLQRERNHQVCRANFPKIRRPVNTTPAWMIVTQNVDLTDLDALSLPKTLASLSIQWTSDWNTGAPDLIAVKDRLVPRLPSLRRLWLYDFSELALLWSRTDSPSEGRCTLYKGE